VKKFEAPGRIQSVSRIDVVARISGYLTKSYFKEGDIVKKGDILVYPYIIDASGNQKPIIALAEINAKVSFEGRVEFNENQLKYTKTGKSTTIKYYSIFGFEFKLSKTQNKYDNYELSKQEYYVFKNNLVPIKVISYTYYQTKGEEVKVDFESVKDEQIELSKSLAYKQINNQPITNEQTLITQNGNIYYVITYLTTIQSIV